MSTRPHDPKVKALPSLVESSVIRTIQERLFLGFSHFCFVSVFHLIPCCSLNFKITLISATNVSPDLVNCHWEEKHCCIEGRDSLSPFCLRYRIGVKIYHSLLWATWKCCKHSCHPGPWFFETPPPLQCRPFCVRHLVCNKRVCEFGKFTENGQGMFQVQISASV